MAITKKLWQTMAFILVAALVVASLPVMIADAQSEAIVSSTVRGELNEKFAKHYLELRVTDPTKPVKITMDYNPKDRQELDQAAGFYLFDAAGFQSVVNGANPATVNLAVGALETATGVKQKVAVIARPVGNFSIITFNDTDVPMDYTLTVENGVIVDASGEQVTDPSAPVSESTEETPEADVTTTATATATPTVAATSAVTTTPTAAATTATTTTVSVEPTILQTTTLEGVLSDAYQVHIFPLEVNDARAVSRGGAGVQLRLNDINDAGIQLIVFTEDQFNTWATGTVPPDSPRIANKIVAGPVSRQPQNIKETYIEQPARTFQVIVYNGRNPASPYELSLVNENGLLIDAFAQSTTAQELVLDTTGTSTTTTAESTTTTTAATDTTPTATATAGANAITPPTTYTVQRGDTMGTISRRAYGTSQLYAELCAFNNINNCNNIEVNQKINVPNRADLPSGTTSTAATATPTPTTAAAAAATTPTPAPTVATTAPVTSTTGTTGSTTTSTASGNLVVTTGSFSVLDTLGLLLDLLELEPDANNNIKGILTGGTFTFFAPTDTAFTSLDEAQLEQLIANPTQLADVLKFHIVPGQFTAADLTDGTSLTTLSGASLPVSVANGTVTVGGARVVQSDIAATNGVIHIIDTVLVPAQ